MARTKNPNTEQARTRSIRFPISLIAQIEKEAEESDRSVNRVVVRMLQAQLEQENKIPVKKESKAI
jgi:hypothetical protein